MDTVEILFLIFATVTACLAAYKVGVERGEERAKQIITAILKEAERQSKIASLNAGKEAE